jgi:hypothetical protein
MVVEINPTAAGIVPSTFANIKGWGENRSPGAANLRGFVFLFGKYVTDRRHGYAPPNDQQRWHWLGLGLLKVKRQLATG